MNGIIHRDKLQTGKIETLWNPYILSGATNLLIGDSSVGKSYVRATRSPNRPAADVWRKLRCCSPRCVLRATAPTEVMEIAENSGISARTIKRAKAVCGVKSYRNGEAWMMSLDIV